MLLTLDYLGESVRTIDGGRRRPRASTSRLIDVIVASGIERNVSLKLTQLGIDVDRATCVDNLRRILDPAQRTASSCASTWRTRRTPRSTLEIFETLWQQGYRNVGVALQAYLYRTEKDVRRMNELGARVRLVKGAYKEPPAVAYQKKAEVDAAFVRLMRLLLDEGTYPAIATHDPSDDRGNDGATRRSAAIAQRPLRVPDAVRHPARPAGVARRRRATGCGSTCRSAAMVSVLHAAARRTAGERRHSC